MNEYDGPERRQSYIDLDHAMANVERLHGAVTTLAGAVVNTVPRQEIDELREEVRRDYLTKIYFMAGFTVVSVVILLAFMNTKINSVNHSARHNHGIIQCLLGQPEASRTGSLASTALVTCDQTVK